MTHCNFYGSLQFPKLAHGILLTACGRQGKDYLAHFTDEEMEA